MVDLSELDHLASAGVRALHETADGVQLRLRAPVGTPARAVIELVSLGDLLADD
jgi:hypothetical protein